MADKSNNKEMKLASSRDFDVRVYIYKGNAFNITKYMEVVRVSSVTNIVETDDTITFYYFTSPVGVFSKNNVICYVAV